MWVIPVLLARGGVTVITHGLNGNVDGWINGLANRIPLHPSFPGPQFSIYDMYFFQSGSSYFLAATRVGGVSPGSASSGEIIVKLDWRQLADGNSYNTFQIAGAVLPALLSTNFIAELGGHALAEFPLHLIGHSRGGSLVCELSRLLGTNGVWVDHVSTLDPHPLNDPAFPFDPILYDAVDAPAATYLNILFHDNYWQEVNSFVNGKAVAGAYVRELISLNGGYSSAHSDVHLWYHGTVDLRTLASDTEASITSSERQSWWTQFESNGVRAGFLYSRMVGGNRISTDRPVGPAFPAIFEGYNQVWDLGAGTTNNRSPLPANSGLWPNVIQLNRTTTNQVLPGQGMPVKFYYQWARPNTSLATLNVFLDPDLNPLNTNQTRLCEIILPGTGASAVSFLNTNMVVAAGLAPPGTYRVLATISGGDRTRILYAPESVQIIQGWQPPTLEIARLSGWDYRIGINAAVGQTILLQQSGDLQNWGTIATQTLTSPRWDYTHSSGDVQSYFRAWTP